MLSFTDLGSFNIHVCECVFAGDFILSVHCKIFEYIFYSILYCSHPDRRGGSEEEGHDIEEERGGGSPGGDEATSE